MGVDEKDGIVPGYLSGQGSEEAHGETASPREGWGVILTVTGGGDEGGGDRSDSDLNPADTEHGRVAIRWSSNLGQCTIQP